MNALSIMRGPAAIAALFLISSGSLYGQAGTAAAADKPSNGVLELSAEPILGPDRRPESERHDVYGPWGGLVEVKIRNVSRGVVRLEETAMMSEFAIEVFDSTGAKVARTERGRTAEGTDRSNPGFLLSLTVVELVPLQETARRLDLSSFFQVEAGQAYKVTLRRSRGLPKTDEAGKPLKQVEIGCSFEVPEVGILR